MDSINLFVVYFYVRVPTGVAWLGVGATGVVFMTDWKLILGKIPIIKNKFDYEVPQ